ncbi:MAG TPA: tRNA (guanosine(46)-N7)-methyltransferase TrmB [Candidatus Absconditabacterales bacterium]|nr:tRNA (guanosine(46)-N7)-methyltransferase TrmB [Candidatus Absconditabacterales bacterium]HMT27320.1 tRNA (guanosine(46)-N7)-methyltransferase TrmB [Candidatus Absconditabacterales bacterium]
MARNKKLLYSEVEKCDYYFSFINPRAEIAGQAENKLFEHFGKRGEFFGNKHPIVLELGCGRGEHAVGLAEQFPNQNFIGLDIKGDRLCRAVRSSQEKNLKNVAFVRGIAQHLDQIFDTDELSAIRITHPDPRPKDKDTKRRFTSDRYMDIFQKILFSGGRIMLKTDDPAFFQYSLTQFMNQDWGKLLYSTDDLRNSPYLEEQHGIVTGFEKKFLATGKKICYAVFQKN